MVSKSGIYTITNLVNGKKYVGQSNNIPLRFTRHRHQLRKGTHYNRGLQAAWNKYGEKKFEFAVVCYVISNDPIAVLNYLEKKFIADLRSFGISGYNFTTGGDRWQVSEATRKRLSDANRGKKKSPVTTETREKLRLSNLGKTRSPETRAKMSASRLGVTPWNKSIRGYKTQPASPDRKRKIGDAQRGSKNHNFGKLTSEETKLKIRAALQGSSCHNAKLTEESVFDIKRRLANGERCCDLAAEFNVAGTQISSIKHGKTWKHVIWPKPGKRRARGKRIT